MSTQQSGNSPQLEAAMQALQKGDVNEAESLMKKAAKEAVEKHGERSVEALVAYHELGLVLVGAGRGEQSLEAFRKACEPPAKESPVGTTNRLTFELSLAGVLEQMGESEEAHKLVDRNLGERATVFGKNKPGYAIAQELRAWMLLRAKQYGAALNDVEQAAMVFGENGRPEIASAIALRAELLKLIGDKTPPFEGLESLPRSLVELVAGKIVDRVPQADPEIMVEVLKDLAAWLRDALGEQHLAPIHVLYKLSNLGKQMGDQDTRETALRGMIRGFDALCDSAQGFEAAMLLGVAQVEAGRYDAALDTLEDAKKRTETIADKAARSRVYRNIGTLYIERGQLPQAEEAFRAAIAQADQWKEFAEGARAKVALAITLQQQRKFEDAKALLEQGMKDLPEGDGDFLAAKDHLAALAKGLRSPLEELPKDPSQAVKQLVLQHAPKGLIESFEVVFKEDEPDVQVKMAREPSPEEVRQLESVVQRALSAVRRRAALT